ncbi:SURF1 family protein [Massilia phyllosphaerae]|uniref:SURF1 family protein n=1 Tax=Massilia phyllosphaerae TaxID=3106034 RepID=UPI002B1CBAB3|nr:SURF1 family protein [Massilia sp. SGZ-792]
MRESDQAAAPGSAGKRFNPFLAVLALLLIVIFAGLGTWQVYRLQWKLDLIARVEARVHAAPAAPPPPARWAGITAASDEYRRTVLRGTYLYDLTTPVQALTEQGSGYWLLTPMCTSDGQIIIVNRGFIPSDLGAPTRYAPHEAGPAPCAATTAIAATTITGLLRIGEQGGAFTRNNDPTANRWFVRDIRAIAAARGVPQAAPFFVDAGANQNPPDSPDRPVGGLTVVNFPNSHLVYAITWYALALMVGGAWWWAMRAGSAAFEKEARANDDERID